MRSSPPMGTRSSSRGRRSAGGPGVAWRAGRDLRGDAALRAGLQDPSCRRARAARRRARLISTGGWPATTTSSCSSFPTRGPRSPSPRSARDRKPRPRRRGQGTPARPDAGERGAGAGLPARAPLSEPIPSINRTLVGAMCARRAPRRQLPRVRQPAHGALHRDGVRASRRSTRSRRSSACWPWSSGGDCRSGSRSRCAWPRPTTRCCPPRTAARPATSPSTSTAGWSSRATSARSRRSWTSTAGVRTGASATTSPPPRCARAIRAGTLPGRARPARPRPQVRERLPAESAGLTQATADAVRDPGLARRPTGELMVAHKGIPLPASGPHARLRTASVVRLRGFPGRPRAGACALPTGAGPGHAPAGTRTGRHRSPSRTSCPPTRASRRPSAGATRCSSSGRGGWRSRPARATPTRSTIAAARAASGRLLTPERPHAPARSSRLRQDRLSDELVAARDDQKRVGEMLDRVDGADRGRRPGWRAAQLRRLPDRDEPGAGRLPPGRARAGCARGPRAR